jgi:hypothetical protein
MGAAMAALIASAEESARQRRDAAHRAALNAGQPPKTADAAEEADPAWGTQREDANRKQMAVQREDPR